MVYCRQCGTANQMDSAFCENCGASTAAEERFTFGNCQKCGAMAGALDNYCPSCGASLSQEELVTGSFSQSEYVVHSEEATTSAEEEEIDFGPLLLSDEEDDLPEWLQKYLDSTKMETEEEPNWLGEFESLQKSIESSGFLVPDSDEEQQPVDLASWLEEMDLAEEVSALVESVHSPRQAGTTRSGAQQPAAEAVPESEPNVEQDQQAVVEQQEAISEAAEFDGAETVEDETEILAAAAESPEQGPMEAVDPSQRDAIEEVEPPEPEQAEAAAQASAESLTCEAGEGIAAESAPDAGIGAAEPEDIPPEVAIQPAAMDTEQPAITDAAEVVEESEITRRPSHLRLVKPEETEPETAAYPEPPQAEVDEQPAPQLEEAEITPGESDRKSPEEFRSLVLASSCLSLMVPPRLAIPIKARTDAGAVFAEIGPLTRPESAMVAGAKPVAGSARTLVLVALIVLIVALLAVAYLVWFRIIEVGPLSIPAQITGIVGALLFAGFPI